MQPNDAVLIVVDVQNDFCPGGALAVPDGDAVVGIVSRIAKQFSAVVMTQDWHPADHISFASQHAGRAPFETVELPYGTQVLWPDHCVQGTAGAAFHPGLVVPGVQAVFRKGFRRMVDSYSGFLEADRTSTTGLGGYLAERGLGRVFVAGLATDFCVAWTALDAQALGLDVTVIEDACRGIDAPTIPGGTLADAWRRMSDAGVRRGRSDGLV